MEKTFIYVLKDPITNEIRYVGKSNNLRNRLYSHIIARNNTPTHKNNWIKSLVNIGLKPVTIV